MAKVKRIHIEKRRKVKIHFNRIGMQRKEPEVWTVRLSDRCFQVREIICKVTLKTVFKGFEYRQPRAWLEGFARIKIEKGIATLY